MGSYKEKLLRVIRGDANLRLSLILRFPKLFSDEKYIRLKYKLRTGKDINLENPTTFNEKLNWLKLNYHNPMMTVMADKYWVKQWVAEKIGAEYVVPCYGKWADVESIPFDQLPDKCFLKSNQDSGVGIVFDRKAGVKLKAILKRFSKGRVSGKNYYWFSREWGYKNIEPCILAEQFLDEGTGHELQDYKFWCFNGVPQYMYITNKGSAVKENFYDMDFNPVDINHGYPRVVPEFKKPENFEKMKQFAAVLSKGMPFVRIDFFDVKGSLYFGECTFYDWGGMKAFSDDKWDLKLGGLISLPSCSCHKKCFCSTIIKTLTL